MPEDGGILVREREGGRFRDRVSGDQTQAPLEALQRFGEAMGGREPAPAAEHPVLPAVGGALLGDCEGRQVVGVTEDGEGGATFGLIDCVVAPLAAGDTAAVEGEKQVELGSIEEGLALRAAEII